MTKKIRTLSMSMFFFLVSYLYAQPDPPPFGADAVPDLYSADLAGQSAFSTSSGGAPVSAINPAQAADATRMIFDANYLAISAISGMGKEEGGYMQALSLGALFPTRYGVFGGSLRYIGGFDVNQFDYFPINPTFGGNLFASKEVYPGMSVGIGFNFGFGERLTLTGDLGFKYNTGKLGILDNFTWAVVFRALGVSYYPTWLTPMGGVSFDLLHITGSEGKKDPLVINASFDIGVPSLFYPEYISLILKAGIKLTVAQLVTLSVSWPGGSGLNVRELADNADVAFSAIPSIGLSVNIPLPSGGQRIAGGRLPSDGDLKISAAFKPLYEGVTAIGSGVSWYAGLADNAPPLIHPDYPQTVFFSPNNDGKSDTLEFPVKITDQGYITSWKMEIKNEKGDVVRVIENKETRFVSFNLKDFFKRIFTEKKQIDVPSSLSWDGLQSAGNPAPDGKYFFTITAMDDSGHTAVTEVYETVLKNTPPSINLASIPDSQKIFDPKGSGGRSTITFNPSGTAEDAWESAVYNALGERIRVFEKTSGTPRPVVWNGRDDSGQIVPDGVYSFRISATDKAQNSAQAQMTNIILDSREAAVFLTSSVSAIAPAVGQSSNMVEFTIRLLLQDGIDNWKLELLDEKGEAQRVFSGSARVPSSQGWNGLNEQREIREGVYTPKLTVTYTRGDTVSAAATTVTVDVSGPELALTYTPEYFSPDNDGDNDELFINLSAKDVSPIANWVLEIRSPESPYPVFRRTEGRGVPSNRIIWDGRSDKGELVQSAVFYPYTFSASDTLGNSSSIEGRIGIDVLVIRDGDRLKMQIPSIIFRPDYADFAGLSPEVIENNNRIIRRIAQILNQFRDYRVHIEGHANPVQPIGPARDREEPELRRISEARARMIVDLMVRNGVARNRLSSSGVGSSKPIAEFEDRNNWWKNRRVEFYLIK